jgi:hypothetical protein
LARETEVLGENLPQCPFVPQTPHACPEANPGRRGGKPVTNRLSYGTAHDQQYLHVRKKELDADPLTTFTAAGVQMIELTFNLSCRIL